VDGVLHAYAVVGSMMYDEQRIPRSMMMVLMRARLLDWQVQLLFSVCVDYD
jgi:hypothetical protein